MFLTVRQVAKRLNVSASCVYQLVETGKLPNHRIGLGRGAIRVSEADLEEYLASCRREKMSETPRWAPRVKLKHLKI